MKTRNENITLIETINIIVSFTCGCIKITDNVNVKISLKTYQAYSISSKGCAGWSNDSYYIIDLGEWGSFGSNTKDIKEHDEEITMIIAEKKHNCIYNPHLKKYFKKSNF